MATVYTALDTRLDRTVALKVMHPGLADDEEFVARFIREAKSAARLSHPNVVSVFDQGRDDGQAFLVMEYVPGRTLRDLLHDRGRLSPAQALEVLDPVLAALAAAHEAGLVHRDVKPENVLLADDGGIKVADFGLARAAAATGATTTRSVLIGTVAYLAPEQVERGVADPRADVYAAGTMLYELLTGSPPFDGETPMAVAFQHVHAEVPPPSQRVPGIPADVDALVATATRRDPDERFPDAGAFLHAVRRVRRTLPAGAPGHETVILARQPRDTLVVPRPAPQPSGPEPAGPEPASRKPGASLARFVPAAWRRRRAPLAAVLA